MATRRFLPLVLLAIAAIALWCALTSRWSIQAWQTPMQLNGDPLEIYARVQAAADDLSQPLRGYSQVERLGAPFGADWSRYPISDRLVFTVLGAVARFTDVFTAVNLAMAVVHALNALAFYLCARFLRWRIEWAFALALLFSFSSYNFRWGVTVSLSLTFAIPPLLLLCGWIARGAPVVRTRGWMWLAGGLGAWFGGGNPYLAFFAVQFVALAVALQLFERKQRFRARAGFVFIAALTLSFLLHNAAYFLSEPADPAQPSLARNYAASELYGLKLTDLVVPPAEHPIPAFRAIGRAYHEQTALRTEFFVNYLGVVGLLGLGALLWAGARGMIRHGNARVPDAFLAAVWTLAFSAVGGMNSLLALAGFDLFRASNRSSIFLLAWALFFLGAWCQRRAWLRSPALRLLAPAALAVFGVFDCVPRLNAALHLRHNAATLRATREQMQSFERELGRGARIFQLPTPVFPEAGRVGRMDDYEHFLPYLCSETLRFSYGPMRGTVHARVNDALAQLPARTMVEKLEANGFSAVWLDRRGYGAEAKILTSEFRALGLLSTTPSATPHVTIFRLQPDAPVRPVLFDPDLFPAWNPAAETDLRVAAFTGWYPLERDDARAWRWARDEAALGFRLPSPRTVQLAFRAYSRGEGDLILHINGRDVWRRPTTTKTRERVTLALDLPSGLHHLEWRYTGRVAQHSSADPRKLGFAIENLELTARPRARE